MTAGIVKQDKGDLNGALADYNKAIGLDGRDPDAFISRGNLKQAREAIWTVL